MTSLEKSICFVCWHGIGMSLFCGDYFEAYLKSINVNHVQVSSAGVQWIEPRYEERIKKADLVVITYLDISEEYIRKKIDFKGKVIQLGNEERESSIDFVKNNYKIKQFKEWPKKVYEQLLQT